MKKIIMIMTLSICLFATLTNAATAFYPVPVAEAFSGDELEDDIVELLEEYDVRIYSSANYKNFEDMSLPVPETVITNLPGSEIFTKDGISGYVYTFSSDDERTAYMSVYLAALMGAGHNVDGSNGFIKVDDEYALASLDEDGYQFLILKM